MKADELVMIHCIFNRKIMDAWRTYTALTKQMI